MSLGVLGLLFFSVLTLAYRFYGKFVAEKIIISDSAVTPAHQKCDGVDFVPTKPGYLFAQHFSAIAAAGPIAGPILACMSWGWGPSLIWIALGVVLIGAVHDFTSLTLSVRHGASSIAEITRERLGTKAGRAMMIFIWLALVYVVVAFTDITSASFVGVTEELAATGVWFNPGGAVAAGAVMYLSLSVVMGLFERYLKFPLWLSTVVFVPLAFAAVWAGTHLSTLLVMDAKTWCVIILLYCFVASLSPMWLLLQPRGYLGGFFLYSVLALGVIGVFFGNFEIKQQAFKTWDTGKGAGMLMPFLFVTIACGACSGFHGLVCSGTTSKQIAHESHMRPIGYGAMLCEAFVALIALVTIMIWSPDEIAGMKPGTIYGKGIGEFLSLIIGREHLQFATTFGAMAFSTFVFDTLDVTTRLGRYLIQELFQWRSRMSAILATAITCLIPLFFLLTNSEGSYLQFWTLFGASNQLLAALTLMTISVWLFQTKRPFWFTLGPTAFVFFITIWALSQLAKTSFTNTSGFDVSLINGLIACSLIGLAFYLISEAWRTIKQTGIERGTERKT